MLLCPPQHGKSRIASERFPAYLLGQNPQTDVISASATAQLAEKFGREVRNCISSSEYINLFETRLAEDSQAKGLWNTDKGGGYYAVGIGGALMGRGGELGIIDDPFATWEDAQSQLTRDKAWDWYTGTFYNRIRPGGSIIVIQHRMHEDDLVGRLLQQQATGGDKWEVIELPALLEDPPWVERYDREALERIKAISGPRKWSALYMQNPTPDDGTYFKREWFNRYSLKDKPKSLSHYGASDYAVTEGGGDFTEHGVGGFDSKDDLYIVDWWTGQTTADHWIDSQLDLIKTDKPHVWVAEGGLIRRSVEPFLKKRMQQRSVYCRIEWLNSHKDKAANARAFQGLASMGKVWIPDNDWGEALIDQLLKFPAGKFDDKVDVCGLFGRILDQAYGPASTRTEDDKPKRDGYGQDDEDEKEWKTS